MFLMQCKICHRDAPHLFHHLREVCASKCLHGIHTQAESRYVSTFCSGSIGTKRSSQPSVHLSNSRRFHCRYLLEQGADFIIPSQAIVGFLTAIVASCV